LKNKLKLKFKKKNKFKSVTASHHGIFWIFLHFFFICLELNVHFRITNHSKVYVLTLRLFACLFAIVFKLSKFFYPPDYTVTWCRIYGELVNVFIFCSWHRKCSFCQLQKKLSDQCCQHSCFPARSSRVAHWIFFYNQFSGSFPARNIL
jgi:hypothetical protein